MPVQNVGGELSRIFHHRWQIAAPNIQRGESCFSVVVVVVKASRIRNSYASMRTDGLLHSGS